MIARRGFSTRGDRSDPLTEARIGPRTTKFRSIVVYSSLWPLCTIR